MTACRHATCKEKSFYCVQKRLICQNTIFHKSKNSLTLLLSLMFQTKFNYRVVTSTASECDIYMWHLHVTVTGRCVWKKRSPKEIIFFSNDVNNNIGWNCNKFCIFSKTSKKFGELKVLLRLWYSKEKEKLNVYPYNK